MTVARSTRSGGEHAAGRAPVTLTFRPDIAGMRAVAVGAVLIYHAGVPWMPGGYVGVDAFFVISGFLMTALITKEIDRTGRVDLLSFYARRVRRLVPAAMVVLLCTVAAAWLLLPPLAMPDVSAAAVATALYVANMYLAAEGTDYLASDDVSPLQHYWSLAVEEQFYLVWPVLLLVACSVTVVRRVPVRTTVSAVSALSFALCVWVTSISEPWAFFSLPTRAWELGVGALVALSTHRLRDLPHPVARALSWGGLAVLFASTVGYTETTPFPGWTAAVPVLATAAVLAGGTPVGAGGAVRVLGRAPMQAVGRLSYSLYLWHWPVLTLPVAAFGELGPWPRTALVGLVIALAWVTHRHVEVPGKRARAAGRRAGFALGGTLTAAAAAVGLLAGVPPRMATEVRVDPLTEERVAHSVPVPPADIPANVAPALTDVDEDIPVIYDNCHGDLFDDHPPGCVFGDPAADRSVYLLGDSHAAQWFPALQRAAQEGRWRLTVATKNACPAYELEVVDERLGRSYDECEQWRAAAMDRVRAERPDLVVLGSYSASYRGRTQGDRDFLSAWSDGLERLVGSLPDGTRAVVLGDSPTWPRAPALCLSANVDNPGACSAPVAELVDKEIIAAEARAAAAVGAYFVETAPWLCTDRCQALAANVVVYRDRHHVSATFAELLGERFEAVLEAALTKAVS